MSKNAKVSKHCTGKEVCSKNTAISECNCHKHPKKRMRQYN